MTYLYQPSLFQYFHAVYALSSRRHFSWAALTFTHICIYILCVMDGLWNIFRHRKVDTIDCKNAKEMISICQVSICCFSIFHSSCPRFFSKNCLATFSEIPNNKMLCTPVNTVRTFYSSFWYNNVEKIIRKQFNRMNGKIKKREESVWNKKLTQAHVFRVVSFMFTGQHTYQNIKWLWFFDDLPTTWIIEYEWR